MKPFLKQIGLFYLYNTLAIFSGELLSVFPSLAFRLAFQKNMTDAHFISGLVSELCIVSVLFFLIQRDSYEKRQFSGKTVVLPAIIVCIIKWIIWVGTSGKIAVWVSGGATSFSYVFFPSITSAFLDPETVFHHLFSIILCDFLFILPAFIGGGYFGYWRRIREIRKMKEEHEEKTDNI